MKAYAIAELGYDVIQGATLVILKDGEPYTLTEQEEVKVAKRSKELEYESYSSSIQKAVQTNVDDLAKAHRYDNMMSVRSYTGFPNEFQRECMAMSIWAGDCWATITNLEKEVRAGTRQLPTIQEVLDALPKYEG